MSYNYKTYNVNGLAVGATQYFVDVNADWIFVDSCSTNSFLLQFDNEAPQIVRRRTGLPRPFSSVAVINRSTTLSFRARFFAGNGEMPDFPHLDELNSYLNPIADLAVPAGTQSVIMSAMSADLRAVLLSIPTGEAGGLRIGGSTAVSATQGVHLPVGALPYRVVPGGPLYAFNPAGVAVTLSRSYEDFGSVP